MSYAEADIADQFAQYLRERKRDALGRFVEQRSEDDRSLVIDWMELFTAETDLAEDLLRDPKRVKSAAEQGLRRALKDLPIADQPDKFGPVHVRFTNVHTRRGADETRSRHIGDYFELEGQVSKVSQIKPAVKTAGFECLRCGTLTEVPQSDRGELREPNECRGCDREGPFKLNPDSSQWIDTQKVRIQQPPEETLGGQGASMDVVLRDDAVIPLSEGRFKPGNRVSISGRYTIEVDGGGTEQYFDGDAVQVENTDYDEINIEPADADHIEELAAGEHGNPYDLIVRSIAPSHHGDDHIKLALALQMFRGVRAQRRDGSWTRGDSHVLLLGDPGVGKSSLLRRVADVAPRSTYASGKGASAAGMTAAAVPSDFGDEKWDVQAGVLVLATGGLACVDEIDKVQEDAVSSMHDALEAPQVVEVDKADIHTTLPARTSLLAAGNPKHGRFSVHKDIGEQIDISPTLMSRFDIMFMMKDQPDEERDRELAEAMITGRKDAVKFDHHGSPDSEAATAAPPLDEDMLRKWVAYARQNYYPTIEDDAVADELANTFIKLREQGYDPSSPVPITPRKLEALQRLVEASARIRCADEVQTEDVTRVARLITRSMAEIGMNEDGQLDADVIETGVSKPQQDRMEALRSVIMDLAAGTEDGADRETVLDEMEREGFDREKVGHAISKLKAKGEAYSPVTNHIRLT